MFCRQESLDLIPAGIDVDYHDSELALSKADLIKRLQGRAGLVCHVLSTIDEELLTAVPGLKVVANVAVGFNNIDVAAARRQRGRRDQHARRPDRDDRRLRVDPPDGGQRRIVEADRYVRSGQWKAWKWSLLWGGDIHGKTLGVVGFGRIGRAMARRAQGFGMRVLYHDAVRADAAVERELNATATDLDTLLRRVRLRHACTRSLTPETRHLINERTLRLMKKTATLINASRGPVVDEAALVQGAHGGLDRRRGTRRLRGRADDSPGLAAVDQRHPGARTSRALHSRPASPWPRWPSETAWPCSTASRRSRRCPKDTERASHPPGRTFRPFLPLGEPGKYMARARSDTTANP